MQPKLEKVFPNLSSSIFVKREIVPYMDYPWHYHPEFEIIFVEKSYGIRLMGNHAGNFSDGDLMFIGPNLPHVWKNDEDFYKGNKDLLVDVYVIQFREDALREGFFDLPEFTHIKKLFLLGQQGLLIKEQDGLEIAELIKKTYYSSGIERLIQFFKTLDAIARTENYDLLSSPGYTNSVNIADTERINKVMNFLMENYKKEVRLKEIAALVSLNISSFCRYFRSRTHKTCTQFINEIRIAHACKLLLNRSMTITEICYETGYNNISHFNRQFKLITGLTAREYSRKYLKNAG
ncbi:MAG: AraC family transcriptional regulator [Bacteroidales bacterium]|nr:AraC family transcriptional regulator [Bacteroidales bacterium]